MLKEVIGYLALAIVLKEGIDQKIVEKELKKFIGGEKSSIEDFSPEELMVVAEILSKYAA